MQTKKRNLYTGHAQYAQYTTLNFNDSSTERRLQSDFARMIRQTYSNPLSALIFIGLYCVAGKNPDIWGFGVGALCVVVLNLWTPKSGNFHRLLEHPAILIWELGMLQSNSVCELVGVLIPSFMLSKP